MISMWLVLGMVLGLVVGAAAQQKRVVAVQKRARQRQRVADERLRRVKDGALEEIKRERGRYQRDTEALRLARSELLQSAATRERQLSDQIIELASRPPVVLPAPPQPDLSALIEAVGKSVASVAYGPDRPPLTEREAAATTFELTRNQNPETLGYPSGSFLPDVEMDEWMEEYGVPNRPGWIAGTGEQMMQSTPDDLPPGIMPTPRSNGDRTMFQSGQSAPPPTGGVE